LDGANMFMLCWRWRK